MDNRLLQLCYNTFGDAEIGISPIAGQGSNRRYYYIEADGQIYVGTEGENVAENRAFIYLSRHFSKLGLPVPEVIAVADDESCYLQTFGGTQSVFDLIAEGRKSGEFTAEEVTLLAKVISQLPSLQIKGNEGLDYSNCYPIAEFDARSINWDLNYFKYCFLKTSRVDIDEPTLEADFDALREKLLGVDLKMWGFMYRDFQSRNVMISADGAPTFIDFQGGRRGPVHYDVASFLWQAKAALPSGLKSQLIDEYLTALKAQGVEVDDVEFKATLRYFVIFRLLQVLGAYGFRGRFEKKQHFIESIPPALASLAELLCSDKISGKFPELQRLIKALHEREMAKTEPDHLVVTVGSFSYKKGLPQDESGNGGGYVFDCRALHNPGRYDQYKKLTGRDKPVIDFLAQIPNVATFLNACYELVDNSVATYLRRGFTSLHIWFGCTGGQHRSVYCAEQMARHIADLFPEAEVKLIHREQPQLANKK